MDCQSLRVLEFGQIQEFLQALALTEPGREGARGLHPSTDRRQIETWLGQVTELKEYLQSGNSLPLSGVEPVARLLDRLKETGEALLPKELLEVGGTLEAARDLKALASMCLPRFRRLAELLGSLQPLPELLGKITGAIDQPGWIRDGASQELSRIRKEIGQLRERLRRELEEILERQALQHTLQERLITVRNDRLVIPLRADARGAVEGIVHDTSHSGATCFVEPLAVVPLNNRLSRARSQEREEEARILRELTAAVMAAAEQLRHNEYYLGAIDCVHARVRLSALIGGRKPELNQGDRIILRQAVHPILALQQRAQEPGALPAALAEIVRRAQTAERPGSRRLVAVPVDLQVEKEQRVLIISGANTGGKTVSLKTMGLLGAMVQAGLHIPVAEGSEWPVVDGIFAEIGDEQDMWAHLSTFSARVQRLAEILSQATSRSLVLLDEIGAGTDPAEGAALALAVLDELRQRGCFVGVTTHYHLLKAYGMTREGVENVSVAFDEETGQPTYQLLYGVAGTSNALQIAAELGMPPRTIEAAREYLTQEEGGTIELIRQLGEARRCASLEGKRLKRLQRQLQFVREELAGRERQLIQAREDILSEIRRQAEALVAEAEEELKAAVSRFQRRGLRGGSAARKKVEQVRDRLNTALEPCPAERGEPVAREAEGRPVRLRGVGGSGILVKVKDGGRRAEVQVGPKRVELDAAAVEVLGTRQGDDRGAGGSSGIQLFCREAPAWQERLQLVGLRVDEALPLLDKAIDRAILEGRTQIQVVHGHGTGRLRQAVQGFLAQHPGVQGFHYEEQAQGGTGVTVVELKD